jgi:competence protein ComEA
VTLVQSLAIKLVMLAVAVGIVYWALQQGPGSETDRSLVAAVQDGATERVASSVAAPQPGPQRETAARPSNVQRPAVSVRAGPVKAASPSSRQARFPLDLNTARIEDFMTLPGVGEKLAQRIVEYRKSHGGFRSVEDLRKVKGIGKKRMERLRPLIMTAAAHD